MTDKIRICLICHLSTKEIHDSLPLKLDLGSLLIKLKNHLPLNTDVDDFAIWNVNAIAELEKYSDVIELHVVAPYPYLNKPKYECRIRSTYYHFFRNDSENFMALLHNRFLKVPINYIKNTRVIQDYLSAINPDIIHFMGAENPSYTSAICYLSKSVPTIVHLQTLMNDPDFRNSYSLDETTYNRRATNELNVLKRADYIASTAQPYLAYIKKHLVPNANLLKIGLPLTEPINIDCGNKEFDFVYFAANISKSADWAIEAFILASKIHPGITLDIVGGYTAEYKLQLETRLKANGLLCQVAFEGMKKTHDDVINQVRKSRFAVLPMKIDLLTGTIRECMANGIPVVTNVTPSSPKENEKRLCLLLSEKEDHQAMADNMCKLLEDEDFANMMRENAGITASERVSNADCISRWVTAYKAILEHKNTGIPIPSELLA